MSALVYAIKGNQAHAYRPGAPAYPGARALQTHPCDPARPCARLRARPLAGPRPRLPAPARACRAPARVGGIYNRVDKAGQKMSGRDAPLFA